MKNICLTQLKEIALNGTKQDKYLAEEMLKIYRQNGELGSIHDVASLFNVSSSSISRFIQRIKYPSYKHFTYDFNHRDEDESASQKNWNLIDQEAERLASLMPKNKMINILSSRRGKCVGKFINERLNDGNIKNRLFHESKDNVEKFVQGSKNNILILISLSGYSNIFSKAIEEIAKLKIEEKPYVIIFTAAPWMEIFEKYCYISLGRLWKKKYDIENWKDYNSALLDIIALVINFINNLKK